MTTLNLQVSVGTDNGYIDSSGTFSNTYCQIGVYSGGPLNQMFFRFTGVSGLSGATISAATLKYAVTRFSNGTTSNGVVYAVSAASPGTITSASDYNTRPRTTANVAWNPTGADPKTKDISSVIQELANNYNPTTIVILHTDTATETVDYSPDAYAQSTTNCAALSITYTTGGDNFYGQAWM